MGEDLQCEECGTTWSSEESAENQQCPVCGSEEVWSN